MTSRMVNARHRMSAQRNIKVVKARDRVDAPTEGVAKIVVSENKTCDTITPDELRERFMELRRAYLSFEKFVRVDCGIEI